MKSPLSLALTLFATIIFTQPLSAQYLRCGTDEANNRFADLHPEVIKVQQYLDSLVRMPHAYSRSDTDYNIVIPVVFHIIHNYGPENIPDSNVYDEMRILNEDYNHLNPDSNAVVASFKNLVANTHFHFKLANKDPFGNCTNGIDRIVSLKTYAADDNAKLDPWPRENYLNVWVVNTMPQGVAGYAYLPGTVSGLGGNIDGVLILYDYIGSLSPSSPLTSRALTHEIGHMLDMEHPWGNTNSPGVACGDDGIADTPITEGFTSCALGNAAKCNPPIIENVQNFMDYSYCSNMFTLGQKAVMTNTLRSDISGRDSLWTPGNQAFTGINNDPPYTCSPKADFYTTTLLVCAGEPVSFKDASWRSPINSYNWTFDGGTPATSTDQNPTTSFSSPGFHTVTLSVSGVSGNDTLVKQSYVYVSQSYAQYASTFTENFEDTISFNNDWLLVPEAGQPSKWQLNNDAATSGRTSIRINNFGNDQYDVQELVSPPIDLSAATQKYLYFNFTGASTTSNVSEITDSLSLQYSNDCGKTWKRFAAIKGPQLILGGGLVSVPYVPGYGSYWRTFNTSIPVGAFTNNVRFKFKFTSGGKGNNVYLDDINISDVSGIEPLAIDNVGVALFPNPTAGSTKILYNLTTDGLVTIELLDITGRVVQLVLAEKQTVGEHSIRINDNQQLTDGVYIVRLTVGGKIWNRKLVITH